MASPFNTRVRANHTDRSPAERDLEIGRQIQASFLPKELPELPGWELAYRFSAAREVAGDFYDAFPLAGGRRLGIVVADVCDKGVGAALFMALFRSLLHAFAEQHYSLGWLDVLEGEAQPLGTSPLDIRRKLLSPGRTSLKKAIDLTNDYIAVHHGDSNMFATVFFGVVDPDSGSLAYINAGHEPPLVIGQSGVRQKLMPTGTALGLLPGLEFEIDQVELEPGDILLAFTDGVLDARDPSGNPFGDQRLVDLFAGNNTSAEGILEAIYQAILRHMAGESQFDDITLLAVRRDIREIDDTEY
jgi:sigma-B regulation protein RsbU (phosphoserine phosphatase)